MSVTVIKPGMLTTLQDAGRPGYAHLGVGRSGAFDAPALRIANALCGNRAGACALELTLVGPSLRCDADAWIAVTGAPLAFRIDGNDRPLWAPVLVAAGAVVELGAMHAGCRGYLAIRGGFSVDSVLGSRSADVNAALGPFDGHPLRTGDMLAVGDEVVCAAPRDTPQWRVDPRPWFHVATADAPLRLLPDRHLEMLTKMSRSALFHGLFYVSKDSNRSGLRLTGAKLQWTVPIEMVSEPCVPGALQLPPSGQPIAFGPEGPVSGGYPRLGQIAAVDLARLAQLRPGDGLRFQACTLDEALAALSEQQRALGRLEANIRMRLQA